MRKDKDISRVVAARHLGRAAAGAALVAALTLGGCKGDAAKPATTGATPPKGPAAGAPAETPTEAPKEDTFALDLTDGYTACFKQFEVNGAVDGKLTISVRKEGKPADVSYQGGAPEPVKACLVNLVRARRIPGYSGEPGLALFTYSGTYSNGVEMLSTSWSFKRLGELPATERAALEESLADKPAAPAGEAPAAPAGEAPAAPAGEAPAAPAGEAPAAEAPAAPAP